MEWLLSLAPIALVVLVCGGLHMLMMRGMHGGHNAAAGHGGHLSAAGHDDDLRLERPIKLVRRSGLADASDVDRVAELQNQVALLQREIDAMRTYPERSDNGDNFHQGPSRHQADVAWRNEPRLDAAEGEYDDDRNK